MSRGNYLPEHLSESRCSYEGYVAVEMVSPRAWERTPACYGQVSSIDINRLVMVVAVVARACDHSSCDYADKDRA
jgi:hypothetical protein